MATKFHPTVQAPDYYHKKIGSIVVTVISDGGMEFNLDAFYELGSDKALEILKDNLQTVPPLLNTNVYVVNNNGHITLIDTGFGSNFGPAVGHLINNLTAAGYSPNEVDTVLLTHIHPDHSCGLILADGTKAFPNAEVVVHKKEFDFLINDENKSKLSEAEQPMFDMVKSAMTPYFVVVRTFNSGSPVEGITAIELPGHTIGHTGYLVESDGEQLLIWGDIAHNPTIQLLRPDEKLAMDMDSSEAAASRRRILDRVAEEKIRVGGMHLEFPGIGYVRKIGTHYVYVQEPWKSEV
ncbi:MBL fold metallo-hydrolase [Paenibacillus sp. TAF58]